MKRERKSMICAGVVVASEPPEAHPKPGWQLGTVTVNVSMDGRIVPVKFATIPGYGRRPIPIGTPMFVEFRKVDGAWRQFDLRDTVRRENGT